MYDSAMFDEFSLASQTLGTGYVVNSANGGSVSIITDELRDEDSDGTLTDEHGVYEMSAWNVFNSLFRQPSPSPLIRKLSSKRSYRDEFDDNVNNLYGSADYYFNSNYNTSARRPNHIMFRELSDAVSKKTPHPFFLNSGPIVDFLKDKPSEMTNGRKLALWLMKYKWYYPQGQNESTKTLKLDNNSGSKSHEAIAPIEEEEEDESPQKNSEASPPNRKESLKSKDSKEQNNQDQASLNASKVVAPSLEKAWAYFEHITLPRFVYEETKNDTKNSFNKSCGANQRIEIAESGENHFLTKLYHPFLTPLNQLGDFGLGIALYFSTVRAVMVLLLIAGFINTPSFLYFSGSEYSDNQTEVFWALRGSSICTDYEFVPCIDCDRNNFEEKRLRIITNRSEETLTFALKNNCEGATQTTMITNLMTMIIIVFGLSLISYFLSRQESKFDENEPTAENYTIVIENPPKDANDPEIWKNFFTQQFDGIHVTCCTVAVSNEALIKALVQRRAVLQSISRTLPPGQSIKNDDLEKIIEEMKDEKSCRILNGVPEYYSKLLKLEEKIKKLLEVKNPVASVFITFETEIAQYKALEALNADTKQAKNGGDLEYCLDADHQPLKVRRATDSYGVRWQDLSESRQKIMMSLILPFFVTIGLIVASAFIVSYLRKGFWIFPGDPTSAAIAISIGNVLFPMVAKFLTNLEVHRREGQKQLSLYMKNALFRWFNTVIVISIITPYTSTIMGGEDKDSLLRSVYTIFFIEIVFPTALQFLNVSQNLRRHYFAPRAKTQEDMNTYMGGLEVDLAERYTTMTKILFLTIWYCPLFPAVLFFGAFALFLTLITDKFCLMRDWAPSPRLGGTISRINRKLFFPAISITMAVICSYAWTGFSYDNLCAIDELESNYIGNYEIGSFGSEDSISFINVNNETTMFRFCKQSLLDTHAFPAIPGFQGGAGLRWMTNEQERFTEVYGWTSTFMIVFVIVVLAYASGYNMTRNHKTGGKKKKIEFSASGASGYIPEVNNEFMQFPLIACSVIDLANNDLLDWASPYHPYEYYDLTIDALEIMGDHEIAESAFSKVRFWDAPIF